jgi:hypothetical protein
MALILYPKPLHEERASPPLKAGGKGEKAKGRKGGRKKAASNPFRLFPSYPFHPNLFTNMPFHRGR